MEVLKVLGKFVILSYFLLVFSLMISESSKWENTLLHLFTQLSIGIHKLTGVTIPLSGKFVIANSQIIIQFFGTVGVILCGSVYYKSKIALKILFYAAVFTVILENLPVYKNSVYSTVEVLTIFQKLTSCFSLLYLV